MARDPYKLYPHDYLLRATVLPLIPSFVLPNHLTILRLLLIPIVVYLLWSGNLVVGVPLFIFAAFTDALDGSLARTRRQITPWGIVFDPVADKLLVGLVAISFALQYYPLGLVITAIAFDLLPLTVWMMRPKPHRAVMMANGWGKTKMVLQIVSITLLMFAVLLQQPLLIDVGMVILVIATVLGGIAAVTYSL